MTRIFIIAIMAVCSVFASAQSSTEHEKCNCSCSKHGGNKSATNYKQKSHTYNSKRGRNVPIPATSLNGNYETTHQDTYTPDEKYRRKVSNKANKSGRTAVYKSLEDMNYRNHFNPKYKDLYKKRHNVDVNEPIVVKTETIVLDKE